MIIFSIELSSRFGSIALIEDGVVIAEKQWEENFKNRQQLFDAMASLSIKWDNIDCFAVGRGPGAFSGMRIAFSVANSLAAPARKPVYALNSGAALAASYPEKKVAVVGDARRNQVWAGLFNHQKLEQEFALLERDELAGFIPEDAVVLSPEFDRLEVLFASIDRNCMQESVFPSASVLGVLVYDRLKNNIASEPMEPLYLHPAVFIEPRFPS
ncbi:MAG: tRNA (adenosine(37)-N6)-threonylcarbamoyltransferase complex dimerization subunit type 1 TsaB [Pontiellaceae bacterium]|nr:tRNA (adenosine(37)-N6)-threonylcarbamoyltransferase complex dimerization subunit type 1 TsaB [Pontiellaceae bacterium]MBN2785410.1 tRNA (adenosine(37)-N6)-threonylcarbamoyltransferase complex dimerization subunit type 1 TsaB [Pontiellaceae bacterium]